MTNVAVNFGLDGVEIVNQILFVGDALEEDGFVVASEGLAAGGPGVAMHEAEVAGQNAIHEGDVAAHHGVLDFLFERQHLGGGAGWFGCRRRGGPLAPSRARQHCQQGGAESESSGHRTEFYHAWFGGAAEGGALNLGQSTGEGGL